MSETIDTAEIVNDQAVAKREAGAVGAALPAEQITRAPITAAQAKVDAVAALTTTAYVRAATLEITKEESAALRADFPDEAFKAGAAGKDNLIYIEHPYLRDRFTEVFGMGQWAIVPRSRWAEAFKTKGYDNKPPQEGSRVYVEAMLIVRGCFVGEAVGAMEYYPSNAAQNYGDAVEGAKTAAFRRCAKEFGVGLQAWKKDWTEGWWQRKRAAQRPQPAPRAAAPPASAPAPTRASALSPTVAPSPAEPKTATAKTLEWFLANVGNLEYALQFCIDLAWLMPNEKLADLPLRFVPVNKDQLQAFKAHMNRWVEDGRAEQPYAPGPIEAAPASAPAPAPTPGLPPPPIKMPKDDEWWREIVVVVPRKGMKRDEYLRNPDTIGSLYEARHNEEDARKRLFGFVNNYEAKPWTGNDGKVRPPNKSDVEFREALDAFAEWFEKQHPGEKL